MKYWVSVEGREIEVEIRGEQVSVAARDYRASLQPLVGTPLSALVVDGSSMTLGVEREGRGRWLVALAGRRFEAEVLDERTRHIRSLTAQEAGPAAGGVLKAPMPGLVVRVQVEPGQQVAAGDPLVVLEAMKMENQLRAPVAGTVADLQVAPGAVVEKGQLLITLGPPSTST